MAKLPGILPLRGTIQDMTFAHTKRGIVVRKKTSVDKTRIETDPAFARTRETMADFRTASRSAKVIANAFRASVPNAKDSDLFNRTHALLREVMSFDTTNARGFKTVPDGNVNLIEGFNFNLESKLESILFVPYTATINRVAGELELTLPVYIPMDNIVAPNGATHYRIVATGAELNFADYQQVHDKQLTSYLALDSTNTTLTTLTCAVPANSTQPLMISVGIEFYLESDGDKYPLKEGAAHAIVKVDV